MADGGVQEVLETAPGERPGPSRRVVRGVVLLVVVALAAGAWLTVHRQHRAAVERITACVSGGQRAVGYANARISGMANYVRVTLASGPQDRLRDSLFGMIARTAGQSLAPVDEAQRGCGFGLHPWLFSAGRAHRSYLDYLDEEYRVLASTASSGAEIYARHPLLDDLRARARKDLRAAHADDAADTLA